MVVEFEYYLHDDHSGFEMRDYISGRTGVEIDDDLADRIGRPFYEVTLKCSLDTETGEVKVLTVRL